MEMSQHKDVRKAYRIWACVKRFGEGLKKQDFALNWMMSAIGVIL